MDLMILILAQYVIYIHGYPCDQIDAWQCPRDDLCLDKNFEVCMHGWRYYSASWNISRCPNGGDIGVEACTEELCDSIGKVKCPFDPICVDSIGWTCIHCPSGAFNESVCWQVSSWPRCESDEANFYLPRNFACDNETYCADGSDEKNCTDDDLCSIKTTEERPFKCPFDDACVESEEAKCDCPSGYNDTICTNEHCNSRSQIRWGRNDDISIKCQKDPKCILSSQICNGKQDCPSGGDEDNCSEAGCAKLGKFKCPDEERCIEKRFVCTFDNRFNTFEKDGQFAKNKCNFNYDESDEACKKICLEYARVIYTFL